MITVNIATHKARRKYLKPCIESVLASNTLPNQINVYFNDYKAPKWLKEMSEQGVKIEYSEAGMGDLGASAKFAFSISQNEGVYITLDDDLIVSPAFIGYIVDSAYRFPHSIVGFHGSNFDKLPVTSYYHGASDIFYFYSGKSETSVVDMLGTGCMAFRAAMETKPTLNDFPEKNMTDPYLFVWSKKTETPLICLIRETGFIKEQDGSQDKAIWKGLLKDDTRQTEIINSVDLAAFKKMHPQSIYALQIPTKNLGDASIEWSHMKAIFSKWQNESGDLLVEFGSGISTSIFSNWGNVVSFEHDNQYLNHNDVIYAPIKNGWYDLSQDHKRLIAEAKIMVIDGPTAFGGYRYNFDSSLIPEECTVFIDDCHRSEDKLMAERIASETGRSIKYIKGVQKIMAVL